MASDLLKVLCSCRGDNPSCFKCGGWGYLDSIGKGRASAGAVGAPTMVAATKLRSLMPCPLCRVRVRKLQRHMRVVHGQVAPESSHRPGASNQATVRSIPTQPTISKSTTNSIRSCPYCEITVKTTRLILHIAKHHREFLNPAYRIHKGTVISYRRITLTPTGIGSSSAKVAKRAKRKGKSTTQPRASLDQMPDAALETSSEQRKLDATRDYAHKYRDDGQFGSHPSHDGFDDESKP
jgi:hypothetical protein